MNALLQLAWRARRFLIGLLRLRTRGVKVMLFNSAGELLLVRNSYGDTGLFVLPGGGIGWREAPAEAAARELAEEVGVSESGLVLLGEYDSRGEGKRDRISLYRGRSDQPLRPDPVEIAEARFFRLDALPPTTSPATLRRIRELQEGRETLGGPW